MTTYHFRNLDALPLFATDKEIAVAVVGPQRAAEWLKARFPTIAARPGFPKIDEFHGGRAVPRVKLFYEEYMGVTGEHPSFAQDGKEDWSGLSIRADRKARAKTNSDAWTDKKRKALEEHRAKKAAEASVEADKTD